MKEGPTRTSVVGFVGLPVSGRSEVITVARDLGVPVVSMGAVVREECRDRGLDPVERHAEVARELRETDGPAAVAKLSLPKVDDALTDSEVVAVDGIRSEAEVETFETEFGEDFRLVSIDAAIEQQAESANSERPDAVSSDGREIAQDLNDHELAFDMGAVMDRADVTIEDVDTREALRERIADLLRATDSTPADSVPSPDDEPVRTLAGDELDRAAYARYLAGRISSVSHDGAYAIHLHGPWGSGKSTLLNFLDRLLAGSPGETEWHPRGRDGGTDDATASDDQGSGPDDGGGAGSQDEEWLVVRFNAWQHQHLTPPWWTLMDHVYRQGKEHLSWRDRAREFSWRLTGGRSAVLLKFVAIAWLVAIASAFLLSAPDGTGILSTVSGLVSQFSPIVAILVSVWAGIETVSDSLLFGSSEAAQSYVDSTSDPMNTIADRFETLIDRIPMPVAIFVDDLDRCDGQYVVDLLNGIQTLFDDAQVVFVVAADEDWLNSCFEKQYENQKELVKKPGKSLGELFLEKLFQLSFPVPNPPRETKKAYWESLIRVDSEGTGEADGAGGTSETAEGLEELRKRAFEEMRAAEDESAILAKLGGGDDEERSFVEEQAMREEAVARLADPTVFERTEHVLQPFAPLLEPNPRSMKQFANAYSVNRALATLTHVDVDRETLALWTVLALRWPRLADYVEANPETVERVGQQDGQGAGEQDGQEAAQGSDQGDGSGVEDETLQELLETPAVRETFAGEPVDAELDETAVERCSGIHP